MRHGACGYGYSLGEALISEGLADNFSQNLSSGPAPIWTDALTKHVRVKVMERAERELEDIDYDHSAWFFGSGDLTRWAGYTIGYRLVQLYAQHYPDKTKYGMIDIPHSDILSMMWEALKTELLK